MRWTSIVAIYTLFWALSFFFVLPFRLQRRGAGDDVPVRGQWPGAPTAFSFPRTCGWTTVVAALLFGLFYANYVEGWVPVDAFNFVPASVLEGR